MRNDELYHFGVKGMKWGKRKARGASKETNSQKIKRELSGMDDRELNQKLNRMRMEQQYAQMASVRKKTAKAALIGTAALAGGMVARGLLKSASKDVSKVIYSKGKEYAKQGYDAYKKRKADNDTNAMIKAAAWKNVYGVNGQGPGFVGMGAKHAVPGKYGDNKAKLNDAIEDMKLARAYAKGNARLRAEADKLFPTAKNAVIQVASNEKKKKKKKNKSAVNAAVTFATNGSYTKRNELLNAQHSAFSDSDELYHFGVKGMKWGVRRYRNADGSLTEKGKKKYQSLNSMKKKSTTRLKAEASYRRKGMSEEEAQLRADRRTKALKALGIAAGTAAVAAGSYAVYNKYFKDKNLGNGSNGDFQRMVLKVANQGPDQNGNRIYFANNKSDKKKYEGIYGESLYRNKHLGLNGGKDDVYKVKLHTAEDVKVASPWTARRTFSKMYNNNAEFKKAVDEGFKEGRSIQVGGKMSKGKKLLNEYANKAELGNTGKFNMGKKYDAFNVGQLVRSTGNGKKAQDMFLDELKKKGINAVVDINDRKYSGYHAKNPVIYRGGYKYASEEKMNRGYLEAAKDREMKKLAVREYAKKAPLIAALTMPVPTVLGAVAAGKAIKRSSQRRKEVNAYYNANRNTTKTSKEVNAQVDSNLYKQYKGRYPNSRKSKKDAIRMQLMKNSIDKRTAKHTSIGFYPYSDELYHYGVKGMKWGSRKNVAYYRGRQKYHINAMGKSKTRLGRYYHNTMAYQNEVNGDTLKRLSSASGAKRRISDIAGNGRMAVTTNGLANYYDRANKYAKSGFSKSYTKAQAFNARAASKYYTKQQNTKGLRNKLLNAKNEMGAERKRWSGRSTTMNKNLLDAYGTMGIYGTVKDLQYYIKRNKQQY